MAWGIRAQGNGKWWTGEKWSDNPDDAQQFEDQKAAETEYDPDKLHPVAMGSRLVRAEKLPEPKNKPKDNSGE